MGALRKSSRSLSHLLMSSCNRTDGVWINELGRSRSECLYEES